MFLIVARATTTAAIWVVLLRDSRESKQKTAVDVSNLPKFSYSLLMARLWKVFIGIYGPALGKIGAIGNVTHMCQGLNSHYFHIIGDGHQPNGRGLYTHYKDSY